MRVADGGLLEALTGQIGGRTLQDLLDNLGDGVYFATPDRLIVYWNKGAERITGYGADEVVGRRCFENILMHTDGEGCRLCLKRCPLELCQVEREPRTLRLFFTHRDGRRIPVTVRTLPILDDHGELAGVAETFSDDSESRELRGEVARLSQAAATDPLTSMPNRRALDDALELAFYRYGRHGQPFGLILLDLDHFKQVNDRHGHAIGDDLLREVARSIAGVRRRDELVGRWGGDEFVVVAQPMAGIAPLAAAAERLRGVVSAAVVSASDGPISLTASAGAAFVRPNENAQTLLRRADGLLYESKTAGGNRSAVS